jgi:hypothetical protein
VNEFDVVESATLTQDAQDATGKLWRALLIKAGWGSKGYYTEEALRNDGPQVFKAGTPIFMDHLKPDDKEFYQFGKVANLVGELATDAVWDPVSKGLAADVEIYEHRRELVNAVAKKIGLSIRATTTADRGTIEGRTGRIITGLVGAKSVDLVVRAGAGGQLLDVLESETEEEMEEQQMDEVLAAIAKLSEESNARFAAIDTKLAEVEESLAADAVVETVVETETKADDQVAVEPLTVETIQTLIEDAVAKIKLGDVQESADHEGNEENVDDVEESATDALTLPSRWVAMEKK